MVGYRALRVWTAGVWHAGIGALVADAGLTAVAVLIALAAEDAFVPEANVA